MKTAYKRVTKWYNSHGEAHNFSDFIKTEVKERENYDMKEVKKWKAEYGIKGDPKCIWVTADKWIANSYNLPAGDYNKRYEVPEEEINVAEIDASEGFVIPETDDQDEGFLFIYN